MITAMVAQQFDLRPDPSAGPVTERSAFSVFPDNLRVTLTLTRRPAGTARRPLRVDRHGTPA
ncbi:hypothetical protein [Jidongwangia harbinensis]|uniref:hypothetical protein n=1 Tax=Jidongwangia harbinensis TaxID=2878561 RepID=UPI001CD9A4FA|nr:hypothetical protein [Jidongwangia harbinensis]MCA2213301.1 hypothetical protein [Jidongwangia harbinensis]